MENATTTTGLSCASNTDSRPGNVSSRDASLCSQCKSLKLSSWFTKLPSQDVQLGSLKAIYQKQANCGLCFFILRCFQEGQGSRGLPKNLDDFTLRISVMPEWRTYWKDRKSSNIDDDTKPMNGRGLAPSGFSGQKTWCMHVHSDPELRPGPFDEYHRLVPISQPSWPRAEQQFCSRPLQSDKVDFNRFRDWLRLCREVHQDSCSKPQWLDLRPPTSFRVIDVEAREVIDAPEGCYYTALSYVWGNVEPRGILTEEDLDHLPIKLPSRLHQTIEDALTVTAELGIKYLWVDFLCVAQKPDVNPDKSRQVAQMGAIYASAEIAILAVAGENPTSGLLGMTGRQKIHEHRVVDGVHVGIAYSRPSYDTEWTRWSERAWTFQESRLPRRALAFGKKQVYWTCQCDQWCEGAVLEPEFPPRPDFIHRSLPDTSRPPTHCLEISVNDHMESAPEFGTHVLNAYCELVKMYTLRYLGLPRDGLNGIQGVLGLLQNFDRTFLGTLHYGLPEACFDFALLWVSWKVPSRPTFPGPESDIPSWSWAGWFDKDLGNSVMWDSTVRSMFQSQIRILPAIKWYMVGLDGSSSAMPSHPRSSKYWNSRALPGNPERTPSGADPLISPEAPPVVTSIPIPCLRESYFLHFLTTSTKKFYIGYKIPWHEIWVKPTTQLYSLVDHHGSFSGSILIPDHVATTLRDNKEPLELIFMAYCNEMNWLIFEALENYRAAVPEDMFDCVNRFKRKRKYEILKVMWIDRKSKGYVERRLLAEIFQERWLAADPKTEWITLG